MKRKSPRRANGRGFGRPCRPDPKSTSRPSALQREVRVVRVGDGYNVIVSNGLGRPDTLAIGLPHDAAIERAEVEAAERALPMERA